MRRLTARRVRRSLGSSGIALTLLLCPHPGLPAGQLVAAPQNQPPRDRPPAVSRAGTAVVRGRVVDGVTAAPIARARVSVMVGGPSQRQPAPALTDEDGAFTLTQISAGPFSVMVNKSTYLAGRYPEIGRSMRARGQPLVIAEGQVIDGVTIPLYHGGAIAGRVLDMYGDPIEFAQVRVVRIRGGARPQGMNQTQTNDLGEYRLPRLEPGRYAVHVRPQMQNEFRNPSAAPEAPLPQPMPIYYPSAPSLAQAQPIVVRRGETVSGIDITLGEGLPAVVTGIVVRSDGEPVGSGFVNVMNASGEARGGFDRVFGSGIATGGAFRLLVPPGEYTLDAQAQMRQPTGPVPPDDQLSGSARVVVSGGVLENVTIVVGGGASVSGRVVFEGATPPPPSPGEARVPFFSSDGMGCRQGTAKVEADWTFKVEKVSGTCGAPPTPSFGRWALKSIVINGQNVVDRMFTFEPGQQLTNVQVVVSDKRSQLDLVVSGDDGQVTSEYVALAFPTDKQKWTFPSRQIRTLSPMPAAVVAAMRASMPPPGPGAANLSNLQQQRIAGLPPGEYYIIAIDDIEFDDSQDPSVLEKLAANALRVSVNDDAPIEVPLRRFSFADVMR